MCASVKISKDTYEMGLAFSNDTVNFEDQSLCCVPVRLLKVEDSTYNMQMLGSDCMSSSWCVWCVSLPTHWRTQWA